MIHFTRFNEKNFKRIEKNRKISNIIFSLDFETSSILIDDVSKKMITYQDGMNLKAYHKQAFSYIWMMGINDIIYYGRTNTELKQFIYTINSVMVRQKKERAYIYIHNLPFDFQFLLNSGLHLVDIFAREKRKVMKCRIDRTIFEIRDSYILCNMSLENLAKNYNLATEKKVGQLDYKLTRNTITPLSVEELEYCENDCLIIYEYIKLMIEQYGNIKSIPLTQTGKVRKALFKFISKDNPKNEYWCTKNFKRKTASVTPSLNIFLKLVKCFQGGYTHANSINSFEIFNNVTSKDFNSSYPYVMLVNKYPSGKFIKIPNDSKLDIKNYGYIIAIEFFNLESKSTNNYLSYSKCEKIKGCILDNGRVSHCDYCYLTITEIDFDIIINNYNFDSYNIVELHKSYKKYLPKEFIHFMTEQYKNKNQLKGIKEKEILYRNSKELLNCLYGMCVTNLITDEITFDDNLWNVYELSEDDIRIKLEEIKEKKSAILPYQVGVWITAFARQNLWNLINIIDENIIYTDTDSVKYIYNYDEEIQEYNDNVKKELLKACKHFDIDFDIVKKLGSAEDDGFYSEFKTLGAKKYCYREDNKLKMTISGVSKKGVSALDNDINNFKNGFIFDEKNCRKNIRFYNDEQMEIEVTDYLGNTELITDKYGIALFPTTYKIGSTSEYIKYVSNSKSKYLERINKNE